MLISEFLSLDSGTQRISSSKKKTGPQEDAEEDLEEGDSRQLMIMLVIRSFFKEVGRNRSNTISASTSLNPTSLSLSQPSSIRQADSLPMGEQNNFNHRKLQIFFHFRIPGGNGKSVYEPCISTGICSEVKTININFPRHLLYMTAKLHVTVYQLVDMQHQQEKGAHWAARIGR